MKCQYNIFPFDSVYDIKSYNKSGSKAQLYSFLPSSWFDPGGIQITTGEEKQELNKTVK